MPRWMTLIIGALVIMALALWIWQHKSVI